VEGFQQGLRELGYVEGQNVTIEYRWADGKLDRLPGLARELVRLPVDVLVTVGTSSARAAKQATGTIPIVSVSGNPVGSGLVAGLARPGGNVTGLAILSPEMAAKQLEVLKDTLPKASRAAVLADGPSNRGQMQAGAASLGLQVQFFVLNGPVDFEDALDAAARGRAEAVVVLSGSVIGAHYRRLVEIVARRRLPVIYPDRYFVDAGGLMSYGPSIRELHRRAAGYVDRILKGARPAELPVEQPTKFELTVNLKTARALGLTIPPSVLARADEVIE
jgi:putative ABC transport system substrate-binding protein